MAGLRRHKAFAIAVSLTAGGWVFAGQGAVSAEPPTNPDRPVDDVFRRFAAASVERGFIRPVVQLFRDKKYAGAEAALRRLLEKFPDSALYHYNLGAALARQNKNEEALDSLASAIENGFNSTAILERDPDLESLRRHARYRALLSDLRAAEAQEAKRPPARIAPAKIEHGKAVVSEANTGWEPRSNLLIAGFEFPPKAQSGKVHGGDDRVAELLNAWFTRGDAAGNHGDLYDNRDRGHSRLSTGLLPQVAHVEYGAKARDANIDYGVNTGILFNAIAFGNSSTALTHHFAWRSQARLVLTNADLVAKAYLQYLNNHLYVYPEHRDHDRGHGDLLPANTPYMIISQGSSGSDQPFLRAVGAVLAAFRPEVKQFLRNNKLVMPTVQMVLRKGQKPVRDKADYLSAKAHPSVFAAGNIDLEKMIGLAHGLKAGAIPPAVKLAVLEESDSRAGIDYFAPSGIGEALFNTPSAIARLVRSTRYMRRLVVSAAGTKDPNGRSLAFRWVVLRGDADRIKIVRLDKKGEKVEIQIPWHDRHSVPFSPELETDRVDIGVFADNGSEISAPAFITLFYPGNQKRSYDEKGRIKCVEYDSPDFRDRYVDPLLFPARNWRDCYEYDDKGELIGWNRVKDRSLQRFTRDGAKVVDTDGQGRPTTAERVRYEMELSKSGGPRIVQVPTGELIHYRYQGDDDRIGSRIVGDK